MYSMIIYSSRFIELGNEKTTTINPRKVMSVETVAGYVKVHLFIL